MNTFIIRDESIRERALELVKNIDLGATVKVSSKTATRSTQQNDLMWDWITDIGNYHGEEKEDMKKTLLNHYWEKIHADEGNDDWKEYSKVHTDIFGKKYYKEKSSKKLSVKVMSRFLDCLREHANEWNIHLSKDPDTYGLEWR